MNLFTLRQKLWPFLFLAAWSVPLGKPSAMEQEEQRGEKERYPNIAQTLQETLNDRIDEADSVAPFIVPEGALENAEPFELKTPYTGAEGKVTKLALRSLGMDPTLENQQAYFSKPQELTRYVKQNFWGSELLLEKASFQTPQELAILDGVRQTQSLRKLSLKGALLTPSAFMALAHALSHNASLKMLDLTGIPLKPNELTLLSYALCEQKTLRELCLNAKFRYPLTEETVRQFYDQIKTNTGLRLIIWPGFLEKDKGAQFKKTSLMGCGSILGAVQKLSATNQVAAIHRAFLFKLGIGESKDLGYALGYLELAHKLGHPLAAYEIAKVHEKEARNYAKAMEWLNRSTEQGNMMAFVKRGDYYRQVKPWNDKLPLKGTDYEGAHQNYKVAADHGHRAGLYKLGKMYESGRHVQKDLDKAAGLFFAACQKGYPDAFTALGALYNNPEYSGYNPNDRQTAKYYLEWGKTFAKSRATATKLLSYVEQDEQKNTDPKGKEDKENIKSQVEEIEEMEAVHLAVQDNAREFGIDPNPKGNNK